MKRIFTIAIAIGITGLLSACTKTYQSEIEEKIDKKASVINVIELTGPGWTDLKILHPYQSKSFFGEKLEQKDDRSCLWVFTDHEKIIESFVIDRKKADCIKLPNNTFTRSQSIFLLKDHQLKERKKFKKKN